MKNVSAELLINPVSSYGTRFVKIATFTILTALASQVQIPMPGSVVPLTLQTAVVLLAALCLGSKDGAFSQAFYLVGGALGLPFFAGAAGAAVLFGPTGGYLFGFVLASFVLGWVKDRFELKSYLTTFIAVFLSSLIIFVPGVIVLKYFLQLSWMQAIATGFMPFVAGDVLKCLLTTSLYRRGKKYVF